MPRVTIKRDESGNVSVIGTKPEDNGFFDWAFGKVLAGIYTEISWEPLKNFWEYGERRNENGMG